MGSQKHQDAVSVWGALQTQGKDLLMQLVKPFAPPVKYPPALQRAGRLHFSLGLQRGGGLHLRFQNQEAASAWGLGDKEICMGYRLFSGFLLAAWP